MPKPKGEKSKTEMLAAERVRAVLDYDPTSGSFRWKAKAARTSVTSLIGKLTGEKIAYNGYRYISLDKSDHTVHRLAWLCYYGEHPNGKLSFKDGDRTNCRISNLQVLRGLKGYDSRTPEGRSAYGKAHRKAYPDHHKNHELKKSFGITLAEYTAIAVSQNGCCAICQKPETKTRLGKVKALAVDHNHETGENRGLLCVSCNVLIGHACEDENILISAIKYLQKHNGTRKTFVPIVVKNEPSTG